MRHRGTCTSLLSTFALLSLACSSNGAGAVLKPPSSTPDSGSMESSTDSATPRPADAAPTPDVLVSEASPSMPDAHAPDMGAANPAPNGPTGSWTLVWRDEFDGSVIDATHWNSGWLTAPKSAGQGNATAVTDSQQSGTYFGPAAFSFPGDGSLHIRLSNPVDPGAPAGFATRESGLITTAGLWNFNPASASYAGAGQSIDGAQVLEIRARLAGPTSSGGAYWPAFWMTNAGNFNGGGESYSEEVDLLEGLGNGSTGSNLQLHLHAASEYGGASIVPSNEEGEDFSLAYHTYTFSLSTTQIQCWNDGTTVPSVHPSTSDVSVQWAVPQYLMLAFQATSGASLPTSATGTPNDLMIDYVRVWTAQ